MQLTFGDAEGWESASRSDARSSWRKWSRSCRGRRCLLRSSRITRARAVWVGRRIRSRRCCASTCCSSGMR